MLDQNASFYDVRNAMITQLSSEKDKKLFFLLVICCFEVILCQSLDVLGPWQPWTRCSASCGDGEQIRRRDCLHPPRQLDRRMQTMPSDLIDCHGKRSVVTRRPCKLEPCSSFQTKLDFSSLSSNFTDSADIVHRNGDEENLAMSFQERHSSRSVDDDGCSVIDQSMVCSNVTDEHSRFRRAIRLSLGEMIYSKWTSWTICSCTTATNERYRFCIAGKRQCLRAKGRFPTSETSPCQCGDKQKSKGDWRKLRMSQKKNSDPYTSWSKWGRCPCERDAFRNRNRMCRPGREIACLEWKQLTGIGIVQLKRCRPSRGCQGLTGSKSDFPALREPLAPYHPPPTPPLAPYHPPPTPHAPPPPPVEYHQEFLKTSAPLTPTSVEPVLSWSPWSEWGTCSKLCDTGITLRWRECLDEYERVLDGCEGDYEETNECNTNPCQDESSVQSEESNLY